MMRLRLIVLGSLMLVAGGRFLDNVAWAPENSDHETLRGHTIVAAGTVIQFATVSFGRWFEFHGNGEVFCFQPVETPPIEASSPHPALALVDSDGTPKIALLGGNIGRVSIPLAVMEGIDCPYGSR